MTKDNHMCFNVPYIVSMTVVKELVKRVENVFAERLKLESPFVSALTACIRAFFIISSLLVLPKAGAGITNTPLSVGSSPMKLTGLSEGGWKLGSIPNLAIKISGLNRFLPDSLKGWMKNEKQNIRLCERLSNLNLETRVKQRDQGLLPSCELTGFTKRLIDGEGLISTLIRYMRMVLLGSRGKAVLCLK